MFVCVCVCLSLVCVCALSVLLCACVPIGIFEHMCFMCASMCCFLFVFGVCLGCVSFIFVKKKAR